MEIIKLVEGSELSVKATLKELGVNRSTFYDWYRKYQESGYDGLVCSYKRPHQFWNEIPETERERVVQTALKKPELSPRELACHITDTQGYYISESSVYRILKAHDLISSPAFTVITAADKFAHPTQRVNQLWQTDFTYLKVIQWGWYYLSTVMDGFSRYILSWELCQNASAEDVKRSVERAISISGVKHVDIVNRPRLLSDNGSCYVARELASYLEGQGIGHVRSKPYHSQTQGKIERYHRSLKNIIELDNYWLPDELRDLVLLCSGEITAQDGSLIKCQLISQAGIGFQDSAGVAWPGIALLFRGDEPGSIRYESAVESSGALVLLVEGAAAQDWRNRTDVPGIIVGPRGRWKGLVYSEAYATIQGRVTGNISAREFYLYARPTAYFNWLVDAEIESDSALVGTIIPTIFAARGGYACAYFY